MAPWSSASKVWPWDIFVYLLRKVLCLSTNHRLTRGPHCVPYPTFPLLFLRFLLQNACLQIIWTRQFLLQIPQTAPESNPTANPKCFLWVNVFGQFRFVSGMSFCQCFRFKELLVNLLPSRKDSKEAERRAMLKPPVTHEKSGE